jgi:hypothetical protein
VSPSAFEADFDFFVILAADHSPSGLKRNPSHCLRGAFVSASRNLHAIDNDEYVAVIALYLENEGLFDHGFPRCGNEDGRPLSAGVRPMVSGVSTPVVSADPSFIDLRRPLLNAPKWRIHGHQIDSTPRRVDFDAKVLGYFE